MNINIMDIAGIVDDMAEILSFKPIDTEYISLISEISGVKNLGQFYDLVVWYYNETGAGKIGAFKMLKWEDELVGIENYDKTTFEDLIGYEEQKEAIIQNTEAFVNGHPANNALLIGGRGTGKSSAVKAVANKFSEKGLRLIELRKEQIVEIPKILKILSKRKKYFIIFIDDLSFDEFEIQYKYMKSILEGGVEIRPKNVLFYATSNRTHIVQEKWIDRKVMETNLDDDVHQSDAIQEKLSLSDRFGLTITYTKPTPAQYLEIVAGICNKSHLEISDNLIKELAFKWEVNQGNLSGRKAKQFVDSLLSQYQN